MQRFSIKKQLLRRRTNASAVPVMALPREAEVERLRSMVSVPPVTPLVVVGVEGVGSSQLVRSAIEKMTHTLHLNTRQTAGAQENFLFSFVRSCGYFVNPSILRDLNIVTTDLGARDIEKAMMYLIQVLQQIKEKREARRRWRSVLGLGHITTEQQQQEIPVIWIDELHDVDDARHERQHSMKLLLWALFAANTAAFPEPDYVSWAKASYRRGALSRHTRLPPPDTWALGAALIYKHNRSETYFRDQAQQQLTNFTLKWLNTTKNGTLP